MLVVYRVLELPSRLSEKVYPNSPSVIRDERDFTRLSCGVLPCRGLWMFYVWPLVYFLSQLYSSSSRLNWCIVVRRQLDDICLYNTDFYARQLYRQVLLRARISYGNSVRLSVRPSVRLSRPGIPSTPVYLYTSIQVYRYTWYTKHRWDRDSGSSPYGSLEYLVSYEVIWCQWVKSCLLYTSPSPRD